jgi:hypothetical protein
VRYKNLTLILILLTITVISSLAACSSPPPPPQFDVTSLTIKPKQVLIGDTATITAEIANTGGSAGIYNAILTVDGSRVSSKAISLAQGSTDTVTFSLSKDKAGAYKIAVGDSSSIFTVNPKMASKPSELKYDDGFATDYLGVDKPCTGYLIDFVPPSSPFTINTVRIYGLIYGGHGFIINDIDVQIWDKDKNVIYKTTIDKDSYPLLAYLPADIEKQGGWAEIHIPDVKVDGNFYIHAYTGITTGQGFRMGADDSGQNAHSDVTVRDAGGVDNPAATWPYLKSRWFGDKSRVNWMVRVSGTSWITEQ